MADLFDKFGVDGQQPTPEQEQDLFSQFDIQPISITEQNINAVNSGQDLTPEQIKYQQEDVNQWKRVAESRFTQEKIDSFQDNPIGFWEAKDFLDTNQVMPLGGFSQVYEAGKLFNIGQKYQKGEDLTESEKKDFNEYIDKVTEMKLRGFSVGGGVMYYGAQAPAFMAEFAATGGVGKLAQKAATKAVAKGAETVALKGALAATTKKIAGTTANITARTAAMPARAAATYGERRLTDTINVTDKGDVLLREPTESKIKSGLMSYAYTSAEVASELSGAAIGKYVVQPAVAGASKVLRTPLIQGVSKLSPRLQQAIYKGYQATKPNAQVSKVLSSVGWNGMLEEMGEEELNRVITAGIALIGEDDYTVEDALNEIRGTTQDRLVTAGIVSIFGGVSSASNIVMNRMIERGMPEQQAKEVVENMTQEELDNKSLEEYPLPTSDYSTSVTTNVLQTEEFKDWFGDSKVTNEKGEPLVVFHGTDADFDIFDIKKAGTNTDLGIFGKGFYFSNNRRTSESYGTNIKEVNLVINNPLYINNFTSKEELAEYLDIDKDILTTGPRGIKSLQPYTETFSSSIKEKGHDGVITKDGEFVTFKPEQIRDIKYYNKIENTAKSISAVADVVNEQIKAKNVQEPPLVLEEESGFNKFYREWVNKVAPLEQLDKEAREKGLDTDLKLLTRTYAGNLGRVTQNLQVETFRIDETGTPVSTGKSLKSIMDDWDNTIMHIETSRDKREQDYQDYLVATRTLKDLDPRGIITEEQKLKATKDIARIQEKYGDDASWFEMYSGEVYDFQKRILFNLVDSGVMSEEMYNNILEQNPNYIPFQRVMEAEPTFREIISQKGVFTNANSSKVIKKIYGSDKDVKDVFQSIIKNTAQILDLAERNKVATQTADIAVGLGYGERVIAKTQPKDTFVVYRDGKKEFYRVEEGILEAINQIEPVKLGFLQKLFSVPATLVRTGATLVPEFWVRNVLRDQHISFLQTDVKGNTVFDTIRGMTSLMKKDKLYNEWMQSGGSFNSYMELDDKGLEKAYTELFRKQGKLSRYIRNPLNLLGDVSGAFEQATRLGVYSKSRKAGQSGLESALEAREATLDFARSGAKGRVLNTMIPFLNAGIQATDKMARVAKENPRSTAFWGFTTITMPSVMLTGYYLYAAPEDERQEYLEIPQWQKDMFWVVKVGDEWLRYPKPFAYGYLFGSLPQRFMEWGYQGDKPEVKDMWLEMVKGTVGAVSPIYDASSLIPPAFKVILEDVTNYNFFTGRNIYPTWMDKLEPSERATKYTSETSKLIGKELNISPAKIDNTVRGVFSSLGVYGLNASDQIINQVKEWNGEKTPDLPRVLSDVPVVKAFAVRSPEGYRSISASNFMKDFKVISEKHATYNKKKGEEKREYFEENKDFIISYKPVKSFNKRMRALQKQINIIYDDEKMDAQKKVDKITALEKQITKIARDGNKFISKQIDTDKIK